MNEPTDNPARPAEAEYRALVESAGLANLGRSTLIEIGGTDRSSFLHNLCTNDINGLRPGQGCELFLTNVKGKTIGHGVALCGNESIVLVTVAGMAGKLIGHLDKYLIREDVQLVDRSDSRQQLLLAGPRATDVLTTRSGAEPPQRHLQHAELDFEGVRADVYRTDFYGPIGFVVNCGTADVPRLSAILAEDVVECGPAAVETVRIEAGTPVFGNDITEENLPQEIDRDQRAVSFTKGCYLGQETVARIDALGHVNRKLRAVRFDGETVPVTGTELRHVQNVIGHVTSATFSPRLNCPLALAQLKRGHWETGSPLKSDYGTANVVSVPLPGT